ncbi:MAG: pseudouridine synthase, partial [Lentisphaerota bacterium]
MDNQNKNENDSEAMRLDRFLSQAGVASRRESAEIVKSGRVRVNGTYVHEPGRRILEGDTVLVGSKKVELQRRYYIMLNKPVGYYSTAADPHADLLVLDLVKVPEPGVRLFTAGRLDKDSEGLIILTNDGDYAAKLTHPKYGILKKYKVSTERPINDESLEKIRKGVYSEGEFIRAADIKCINRYSYLFTMAEGKKREVRRLVASTGTKINRLKRIAIGGLNLGPLPSGEWRFLCANDI